MARYLYHPQSFLKISSKPTDKFSSNMLTDRQTGHGSLPKCYGLLLVPSSIFPENFIKSRLLAVTLLTDKQTQPSAKTTDRYQNLMVCYLHGNNLS